MDPDVKKRFDQIDVSLKKLGKQVEDLAGEVSQLDLSGQIYSIESQVKEILDRMD
jgi:hypothetical protein